MNNKKSKIIILIAIIATVIFFVLGIAVGYYINELNGENVTSQSEEKRGEKYRKEDFSGLVMKFRADVEDITDEEKGRVEEIFRIRLNSVGYVEAMISFEDGLFVVRIPDVVETGGLEELLSTEARVTFRDPDDNIVMDSRTDIKKAEYQYGQLNTESPEEAYVSITLNPDAVSKWAYATKLVSQRTDGKNYISIYVDDTVISAPMVNEEINSDKCIISGGFTPESAQTLVNQINSGSLPFEVEFVSAEVFSKNQ